MNSRQQLHEKLREYTEGYNRWVAHQNTASSGLVTLYFDLCNAVYFQPPENVKLNYPCIIYRRTIDKTLNANNKNYFYMNQYELMAIEKNPVVPLAERIIKDFHYASILNRYTIDNLYHTIIRLYY